MSSPHTPDLKLTLSRGGNGVGVGSSVGVGVEVGASAGVEVGVGITADSSEFAVCVAGGSSVDSTGADSHPDNNTLKNRTVHRTWIFLIMIPSFYDK
jgi:tetrahydrodipicolinate N-succinyltransferase